MNNRMPFLWNFKQNQENTLDASGGGEQQTASANEETKNNLIDFE